MPTRTPTLYVIIEPSQHGYRLVLDESQMRGLFWTVASEAETWARDHAPKGARVVPMTVPLEMGRRRGPPAR